jgi:UDP-N-acetylglucosamine 2-epimerase (non-hydrolysing)
VKVLVPVGTRPEIVKLAPVVRELTERGIAPRVLATGQHYDDSLSTSFYEALGIEPDCRWTLEGDEAQRVGTLLELAFRELAADRPDLLLLVGDTYTVPLFCLAARRFGIPVAHVEAGLRSFNETSLEELNRKLAAASASLHFAPTALAASFLRAEGVAGKRIRVVGNPVIDAIRLAGIERRPLAERGAVTFTAHRASNVDDPERLRVLVRLVRRLADEVGAVTFPIHPRTRARLDEAGLRSQLEGERVELVAPLRYDEMLRLVARSRVVVTDSGGLQEEASWLGVPVVVLRPSTPRWESVVNRSSVLAALDLEGAVAAATRFTSPAEQERVAALDCPFGDGHAAARIAAVLADEETGGVLRVREPDFVGKQPPGATRAVLFDLDDTLFEQARWLRGAWHAVATAAAAFGVEPDALEEALARVAAEGSDRGRIIDRALAAIGASSVPVRPLVDAFRSFAPSSLVLYHGVREALAELRRHVPVGVVTDGEPGIQRNKVALLGLEDALDVVVYSDELGRQHRKPSPAPLLAAVEALGVVPADAVYVGDHPEKDSLAAAAAGMRMIRVRTGEYADRADAVPAWLEASDALEAIRLVRPLLAAPTLARAAAP